MPTCNMDWFKVQLEKHFYSTYVAHTYIRIIIVVHCTRPANQLASTFQFRSVLWCPAGNTILIIPFSAIPPNKGHRSNENTVCSSNHIELWIYKANYESGHQLALNGVHYREVPCMYATRYCRVLLVEWQHNSWKRLHTAQQGVLNWFSKLMHEKPCLCSCHGDMIWLVSSTVTTGGLYKKTHNHIWKRGRSGGMEERGEW